MTNVIVQSLNHSDLTAEEQAFEESEVIKHTAEDEARVVTNEKKATDAKAGNDKLVALGLTQDQVTAMTGYTPPSE